MYIQVNNDETSDFYLRWRLLDRNVAINVLMALETKLISADKQKVNHNVYDDKITIEVLVSVYDCTPICNMVNDLIKEFSK